MSLNYIIIFACLFIALPVAAATDHNALWKEANEFYKHKNFDSAADYYTRIAKVQPGNAEVYYNLGNAYYRLNNIGASVLNYERALKIKPGHKQASDNLYLAQGRITNRIQHIPEIFFLQWWRALTAANLANVYAIVALVLFLLVMGYYIGKRLGRISFHLSPRISVAAVSVCLLLMILGAAAAARATNRSGAVVMQEGAALMAAPKYATPQAQLPEGTKVEICDEKADWLEVTLPDGRSGWVQQAAITRI